MNVALEAGVAIYVAMAVALAVWIGIFVYLWRIDSQARALKRALDREQQDGRTVARRDVSALPQATLTRVREVEGEPVEQ